MQHAVEKRWYASSPGWLYALLPLEWLFRAISALRKRRQSDVSETDASRTRTGSLPPVIVVGNLSVGGTGKTPVIIALCHLLQNQGFKVGVVSRGYGRTMTAPHHLGPDSTVAQAGDEPLEIMARCNCDIVVASDRQEAVSLLTELSNPDLILSDDGLQHYRMMRAMELVVITARLGFGNGHCLPVGPLREPISRLNEVDLVLVNGKGERHPSLRSSNSGKTTSFTIQASAWVNLHTGEREALDFQVPQPCRAYAGIGQPEAFFSSLATFGIQARCQAKPDHAEFDEGDFSDPEIQSYLMTAKDAVKCRTIAPAQSWYLEITAKFDSNFEKAFLEKVAMLVQKQRKD